LKKLQIRIDLLLIEEYKIVMEHSYEVDVNWVKERAGVLYSPDFNDEITVVTPPQFPKGIENHWSPEHLFTAAVNSCLMTTFLSIADSSRFTFAGFSSRAFGKLESVDGRYEMTEVTLKPVVVVEKEEDTEKAMKLLRKSEAACLISNSIRSKIVFEPAVRVKTD
jgi:organic hydroperoxide reductase OsmC/OhrA